MMSSIHKQNEDEVLIVALTKEVIRVGRALFEYGFHAALAGNLSVRIDEKRILCTGHGADKGRLSSEDLVICDMRGAPLEGSTRPTSEVYMHLAAYRERPDVGAVIHAHPPTATAFAAASMPLDSLALPEMLVYLGPVALVPYATPGTEELAAQLRPYFHGQNAFLLENHGALTLGRNLAQASQRMELIEQNARITSGVYALGKRPFKLSAEQVGELAALRRRLEASVS
jgi:L-fuculose-phosphate aldolase